jgi:hypothetical protein
VVETAPNPFDCSAAYEPRHYLVDSISSTEVKEVLGRDHGTWTTEVSFNPVEDLRCEGRHVSEVTIQVSDRYVNQIAGAALADNYS